MLTRMTRMARMLTHMLTRMTRWLAYYTHSFSFKVLHVHSTYCCRSQALKPIEK